MGVSLDGYIVGPDGDFGWTAPERVRRASASHEDVEVALPRWLSAFDVFGGS
jgi:hypothetical protein